MKLKALITEGKIELLDNGNLRIETADDLSPEQLAKISTFMRQKGYDSRGAADAKRAISKFIANPNNPAAGELDKTLYGDWISTIATVLKLHKPTVKKEATYDPKKVISRAKRKYGVTSNLSAAGYILADGSLLKLSHDGISRDLDHREIASIYNAMGIRLGKDEDERSSPTTYMIAFMDDCRAIRLGGSQASVDMFYVPTKQQANQLLKFFSMYDGEIQLDVRSHQFGQDGRMYSKGTPAKIILRDIVAFYNNGELPPQNIRHSRSLEEPVNEVLMFEKLDEIISPYSKATNNDLKRGYIGSIVGGRIIAYDDMVPDVLQIDHSELPNGRNGARWRFFAVHPKNTVLWNEFPPSDHEKSKVEEWLRSKGIHNPNHINYREYLYHITGKWQ